jgi:hypothetical protein
MALRGLEILVEDGGLKEAEMRTGAETYVFLFNDSGDIFLSGNKKDGYDVVHGFPDPEMSKGEWIINGLKSLGLSEDDLRGISPFLEMHETEFGGGKIEIVGILCDSKTCRSLINSWKEPGQEESGFIPVEILINRNYSHLTPNGLGELADQLVDDGVIDRPEIFVPEV